MADQGRRRDQRGFCFAITLAMCLAASGFADEAVRTWTDATGKHKRDGAFVAVDGDVVLIKLADGTIARIPLEKLSPADQSYVKSSRPSADADADPFQTDTRPEAIKPSAGSSQDAADQGDTAATETLRVVVAEGVGVDVESAKADAYRQAVRQVVGAFVDASTLVSNDKLIEDRVVTLSSAFVEKAEPVAETKSGGLVRIRVRAHVRAAKLLDTLNANRIATTTVDSESLVAQVVTKSGQQEGAEAILAKHLPHFHEQCFNVHVVGQPTVGKTVGDSVEVKVRVALSPNRESYLALCGKVAAVLDATSQKHGEIFSDGMSAANKADHRQVVADIREDALQDHNWGDLIEIFADRTELETVKESADREGNSGVIKYDPLYLICDPTCTGESRPCGIDGLRYSKLEKLYQDNGTAVLFLLTKINESFQRTHWRWFHLSKDEAELVRRLLPKVVRCTVTLRDRDGEEIARDVLRLKQFGVASDSTYPTIALSPFFVDEDMDYYVPTVTIERTLMLRKSEVPSLGKAEAMLTEETDP